MTAATGAMNLRQNFSGPDRESVLVVLASYEEQNQGSSRSESVVKPPIFQEHRHKRDGPPAIVQVFPLLGFRP